MTYNTGNPLGSSDPRDLYDNAENLDTAVNDTSRDTWSDRLGRSRKTMSGMEREFNADQTSRENQFQSAQSSREAVFSNFLQASGYQDLGEYAPGIEITAHNQYVTFGGQPYLLKPSIPVPYTTSGAWTGDDFKLIGDGALRQDLASGAAIAVNRTLKQIVDQAYSLGAVTVAASNSSSDIKEYATYVCDGVDDHIQINTALANHPRVVLTDGTYYLGGTVLPQSNTALIGQGKDRTKLELVTGLSSNGIAVMSNSNIDNVVLKGFTIDGNGDQQGFTGNPEGLRLSTGKNFYISDVRVFNINHHAVEISYGAENVVFEDCEFDYCSGDMMEIEIAENVYFYRCKFSRPGGFTHPTFGIESASFVEFEQKNKNIRFIDCDFDNSPSVAIVFSVQGAEEPLMQDIYFTRCNFSNVKVFVYCACPAENVYFTDCRVEGNNANNGVLFENQRDAHNIVFNNCQISDFFRTTWHPNGDLHIKLYNTDLIRVGQVETRLLADLKWTMHGGSISYNPDGYLFGGFFHVNPLDNTDFSNSDTEIKLYDVEVSDLTRTFLSAGLKYRFIANNLRFKNVLMTGAATSAAVFNFNLSDTNLASDMDIYAEISGVTIEDAEWGIVFGNGLKGNLSSGSVHVSLDNWNFQNVDNPFRDDDISAMGSALVLGRGLGYGLLPSNAGVATITSGSTEAILNHIDTFPIVVQDADIQVTPLTPLGNATQFWAYSVGSQTWRIRVDQDPGQDVRFSWRLMRIQPYQP